MVEIGVERVGMLIDRGDVAAAVRGAVAAAVWGEVAVLGQTGVIDGRRRVAVGA
jgi:hypothetical protein